MFLRGGCGLLVDEISADQIHLAAIRGERQSVLSPPDHMLREICEHIGYGYGINESASRQVEGLDDGRGSRSVYEEGQVEI